MLCIIIATIILSASPQAPNLPGTVVGRYPASTKLDRLQGIVLQEDQQGYAGTDLRSVWTQTFRGTTKLSKWVVEIPQPKGPFKRAEMLADDPGTAGELIEKIGYPTVWPSGVYSFGRQIAVGVAAAFNSNELIGVTNYPDGPAWKKTTKTGQLYSDLRLDLSGAPMKALFTSQQLRGEVAVLQHPKPGTLNILASEFNNGVLVLHSWSYDGHLQLMKPRSNTDPFALMAERTAKIPPGWTPSAFNPAAGSVLLGRAQHQQEYAVLNMQTKAFSTLPTPTGLTLGRGWSAGRSFFVNAYEDHIGGIGHVLESSGNRWKDLGKMTILATSTSGSLLLLELGGC